MQSAPKAAPANPNGPTSQPRPKTLRWLIFALVPLVAVAALVLWIHSLAEPEYKGVKLSAWLDRYYNEADAEPQRNDAVEAIHGIGSRAVPRLTQWLGASDSTLKLKLRDLAKQQSFFQFNFSDVDENHRRAIMGFDLLGPQAKSAIPEIEKLLLQPGHTRDAADALCAFTPESAPVFIIALTNRSAKVRSTTASVILAWNYQAALPGLPWGGRQIPLPGSLLLKLAQDSEAEVRLLALQYLNEATQLKAIRHTVPGDESKGLELGAAWIVIGPGPTAKDAIPILLNNMGDTRKDKGPANLEEGELTLSAMRGFGAKPAQIVPVLENLLQSSNTAMQVWAIEKLGEFGPDAKHSAQLLPNLAAGKENYTRTRIFRALMKIDPAFARANAKILDLNYEDPVAAVPILISKLRTHDASLQEIAAIRLGNYGTDAKTAVPALLNVLDDTNDSVRAAIGEALKKN